jgi:hypothetical protein
MVNGTMDRSRAGAISMDKSRAGAIGMGAPSAHRCHIYQNGSYKSIT